MRLVVSSLTPLFTSDLNYSLGARLFGHRGSDLSSLPRIVFVCIVCLCVAAAAAAAAGGWVVIGCGEEVNKVRSSLGL